MFSDELSVVMSLKEALFDNQSCSIELLVTEMHCIVDFEACLSTRVYSRPRVSIFILSLPLGKFQK